MTSASVRTKLDTLPTTPGVYTFYDAQGRILYVGKASNLRARVRSYFQAGGTDMRAFIAHLDDELADLKTIVAQTEKEAALLENQLIKAHQPKYNVKLRDDKEYLSLRLDTGKEWPRLEVVRRPRLDGAKYFGPYDSATSARKTLRLINRFFQLRTCTDSEFRGRKRPCLQYQIKRCPAPCVLDVDADKYASHVDDVVKFLEGRHDELIDDLEQRMQSASDRERYENAATYRDQLRAVERVREKQRVAGVRDCDQDVVGIYRQSDRVEVAMLQLRGGRIFGVQTFALRETVAPTDEIVADFVRQYYEPSRVVPDELILPTEVQAMKGLAEVLSEGRARKVRLLSPKRGERKRLLTMASHNAEHAFIEKSRAREDLDARLEAIARLLRLRTSPRRIECVDISHTAGDDTVAVVVALQDGVLDKSRYRSFHVKRAGRSDDYAAIYEVVKRRLLRGQQAEDGWELPDLLVVDGGKGQLRAAERAAEDIGGVEVELAGIAKARREAAEEVVGDRIFRPGWKEPVSVRKTPALALLAQARDEAHAASNRLRERVNKKKTLTGGLERVPGIGPKTSSLLLQKFGSLRGVVEAKRDELEASGISAKQLDALRQAIENGTLNVGQMREIEEEAIENAFR